MTWEPTLATKLRLVVSRTGLLNSEARIYLRTAEEEIPRHVIRLRGVFKLFDSLPRGLLVQISDDRECGSFGWDIPDGESYHSVRIDAIDYVGSILVLARAVEYGKADLAEALNWPG